MTGATWQIRAGADETTAIFEGADPGLTPLFICAHGAGGSQDDRSVVAVTRAIRARGIATVRFNFFYRAKKSGRPDPMPRLLACYRAVVERVRSELAPRRLIVGGRSMGGRAASMMLAEVDAADGLLLLAYPLHPPGQTAKLRAAHLASIAAPVLCINGTRDPFCERPLMEKVLADLGANWRMRWIEGGDHSFHVLKSSGRTDAAVLDEIGDEAADWVKTMAPRRP
jgi:predicted alpha/beta-hydrolase family hydrolase